jgi:hypothetical protein
MPMHYKDPRKADDPRALPNIETFQAAWALCPDCQSMCVEHAAAIRGITMMCPNCKHEERRDVRVLLNDISWFYWFCLPGCLPDSESFGPFDSEEAALKDARNTDVLDFPYEDDDDAV